MATAISLGIALTACQSPEKTAEPHRFEIPEGVSAPWSAVSAGGLGWAYTELRRSEAFMIANGRRLGPYP